MFERDKACKISNAAHSSLLLSRCLCHPDYISIEIIMQGAFGAWGIHSGLITWISHPIKDISGVLAGLSNSAACSDRLLILQKGWNVCDNISWHLFMWWSEPANATCCRLSKGQRWPWRSKGMFESWHLMTIPDKRDNFVRCVCAGFSLALSLKDLFQIELYSQK